MVDADTAGAPLCLGRVGPFIALTLSLSSTHRLGTTTHDSGSEDAYSSLLQRYQSSEEELRRVAAEWLQCQERIDAYVDEQVRPRLPPGALGATELGHFKNLRPFHPGPKWPTGMGAVCRGALGAQPCCCQTAATVVQPGLTLTPSLSPSTLPPPSD